MSARRTFEGGKQTLKLLIDNLLEETTEISCRTAAAKSTDIDALMALADVPFLLDGDVFTEMEGLRPQFARMLKTKELLSKRTSEIRDVIAFETIAKKDMRGEVGEFVERNLRDGDQIVIADVLLPEKNPGRRAGTGCVDRSVESCGEVLEGAYAPFRESSAVTVPPSP